jgi:flagellar protein FlgJ
MNAIDLATRRLVLDPAAAGDLRAGCRQDPQAGLKQAAQQFEGMLLHLMLKSMRDATAGGALDSEQSRFFTAIGDQQMAQDLAAQTPLGFAGLIEKQLARSTPSATPASSPLEALQQSLLAATARRSVAERSVPAAGRRVADAAASLAAPVPAAAPAAVGCLVAAAGICRSRLAACRRGGGRDRRAGAFPGRPVGAREWLGKARDQGRRWLAELSICWASRPAVAGRERRSRCRPPSSSMASPQSVRAKFRAYGSYAEAFRDYASV